MRHTVMIVVAWAVVQTAVVLFRAPGVLSGQLMDPDDYMRLVRVEQLHATGDWYDGRIARSNAPYGDTLHWTRPLDVLLLVGGWLLSPFMGFERGLFWAGALASPVLQLAILLSIPALTAPLFDQHSRRLVALAVLAQPAIMAYALAGRADHHMLFLLVFAVSSGLMLRVLTRPEGSRLAVAAGFTTAVGMWLSVEFLLPVAASLGALGVLWIVRGRPWTTRNAAFAAGLAAGMVLSLAIERPPADWSSIEYDRLSVVHGTLGVLAVGFWGSVRLVERWRGGGQRAASRVVIATLGVFGVAAAMRVLYPDFFAGPNADLDPRIVPIWYDRIVEVQPLLLPRDAVSLGRFIAYLGATLVCVPFLARLLTRERDDVRWPGWIYLATALVVFLPPALAMARLAIYAELVLAITIVALLGRMLPRVEQASLGMWRVPVRAGLTAGLLVGFMGIGWSVQAAAGGSPASAPMPVGARASCGLVELSRVLADPRGLGRELKTILAFVDHGSELLYRTPHSVVAAPYQRNAPGILDSHRVLTARDDEVARALIDQRGIDLILVCPRGVEASILAPDPGAGPTLHQRLSAGNPPPWVAEVQLPPLVATQFRLYAVVGP